jgi:hypothetical protein
MIAAFMIPRATDRRTYDGVVLGREQARRQELRDRGKVISAFENACAKRTLRGEPVEGRVSVAYL